MSIVSVETLRRLKAKAIEHGATIQWWCVQSPLGPVPEIGKDGKPLPRRVIEWDVSLKCENPVVREFFSRTSELVKNWGRTMDPEIVVMHVRCRKCGVCRDMRQRLWAGKAKSECASAWRTWFCTFTVRPEEQIGAEYRAAAALSKKGVNFHELTQVEQFSARTQELGKELTLFFKRIRKNSGAHIRYLVVAEEHVSGLPHFHALIHDCNEVAPLRKEVIEDAWRIGFSKSRLLTDGRGASYVCKYLSKSMLARVRASHLYGGVNDDKTISDHSRMKF